MNRHAALEVLLISFIYLSFPAVASAQVDMQAKIASEVVKPAVFQIVRFLMFQFLFLM